MKRKHRWLSNSLLVFSLLLGATTVVLWIQSYELPGMMTIDLESVGPHGGNELGSEWGWYVESQDGYLDIRPRYSFFEWKIAYWKLLTLAVILLVYPHVPWASFSVSNRRISRGCCAVCGYDLRATPERCPECGNIATKKGVISNST